jgi:hypothetical protein
MIQQNLLTPKAIAIASFSLCGFANFSSIAMQIGGIGELAPTRKADLARLGFTALLCGTMASYVSSAIAGILISNPDAQQSDNPYLILGGALILVLAGLMVTPKSMKTLKHPLPPTQEQGSHAQSKTETDEKSLVELS